MISSKDLLSQPSFSHEVVIDIDMSNDFVDDKGALSCRQTAQDVVPYQNELVKAVLAGGGHWIVVMDKHQKGVDFPWPDHNAEGEWGSELWGSKKVLFDEMLAKYPSQVSLVPKTEYNAFVGTNLDTILSNIDAQRLHFIGVCSDICCHDTVAGAWYAGFKGDDILFLHSKGWATFTPYHEAALKMCEIKYKAVIVE